MIPGAEVTVVKFAPMGDPMELQVHGYELTLRSAGSRADRNRTDPLKRSRSHAGIEAKRPGTSGTWRGLESIIPEKMNIHCLEGTTLTYALVGNQNCGKLHCLTN